jgi:hypothetical protein
MPLLMTFDLYPFTQLLRSLHYTCTRRLCRGVRALSVLSRRRLWFDDRPVHLPGSWISPTFSPGLKSSHQCGMGEVGTFILHNLHPTDLLVLVWSDNRSRLMHFSAEPFFLLKSNWTEAYERVCNRLLNWTKGYKNDNADPIQIPEPARFQCLTSVWKPDRDGCAGPGSVSEASVLGPAISGVSLETHHHQ